MEWQDYAVGAIVAAIGAVLLRRLWCRLSGRRKGGCSSCGETHCPLKRRKP